MSNILLAIFLWSSSGLVVRLSGVPVHVLIFYSCIVSLLLQGPFLLMRRGRMKMPAIKAFWSPAMLGAVGLVNTFSYYYALKNTTIANAVLTHYTAPVVVAFLAPVFLRERITKRAVAAILISSAGLYLMLNGFTLGDKNAAGLVAGLLSGVAYALVIIVARVSTRDFDPLLLTFIQNAIAALVLIPFVNTAPIGSIGFFFLMGTLHSTAAPMLYYRGLRDVAAPTAAVLGYLEPVCAIAIGMLFLSEVPGVHAFFGGLLILFSGYLTIGIGTAGEPET